MGMRQWMAALAAVLGASCAMVSSVVAQPIDLHPTWQRTITHSGYGARLDVRDGVGALVTTPDLLVAYAADGTLRWQVDACTSACAPSGSTGHTTWDHGVLRADGGAWAVRKRSVAPNGTFNSVSVVRMGSDGSVRDEFPLVESSFWISLAIAAPGNGLVVLIDDRTLESTHVAFASFDASGVRTGDARLAIWEYSDLSLSMHLLPGGDVTVAAQEIVLCFLGCALPRAALLRLRPSGAVAWRHDFDDPDAEAIVSLEPDGSASSLVVSWPGPVERHLVDADGAVWSSASLPAFSDPSIRRLSPLVGGRQLVEYLERQPEIFSGIALLDRRGMLVARRSFHSYGWIHPTPNAFGFIGDDGFGEADAELMSASTLETLARFHLDTPGAAESRTSNTWHVLDNGIVYGFGEVTDDSGARHFALARFDLVATGASSCTRDPRPQDGPVTASPRATASSFDGCTPRRPIRVHAAPPKGSPVR